MTRTQEQMADLNQRELAVMAKLTELDPCWTRSAFRAFWDAHANWSIEESVEELERLASCYEAA